jgi:hypothetical protein
MVAAFDEMQGRDGAVRPAYGELARRREVPIPGAPRWRR